MPPVSRCTLPWCGGVPPSCSRTPPKSSRTPPWSGRAPPLSGRLLSSGGGVPLWSGRALLWSNCAPPWGWQQQNAAEVQQNAAVAQQNAAEEQQNTTVERRGAAVEQPRAAGEWQPAVVWGTAASEQLDAAGERQNAAAEERRVERAQSNSDEQQDADVQRSAAAEEQQHADDERQNASTLVQWPRAPVGQRRAAAVRVQTRAVSRFTGYILNYDRAKGFGFIGSEEVPEGDVYFKRSELPQEVRSHPRAHIIGMQVDFAYHLASQGRARAERLKTVDEATEAGNGAGAGAEGGDAVNEDRLSEAAPPRRGEADASAPPLGPRVVTVMSRFLEAHGGVMDYGTFSTKFPGVKKPQLMGHFALVAESSDAGGRWQISLPGAAPRLGGARSRHRMRRRGGGSGCHQV